MTGAPAAVVARAPGRVNLIGDHTDYTGGLCLPMAVDRWVEVTGFPSDDAVVRLTSDAEAEPAEVRLPMADGDVADIRPEWARYVAGVVAELRPRRGFRGAVTSTVPIGAGLSSSAALEVAVALVLGADPGDRLALAERCRAAEHRARGVPTGLLDQLSCLCGVAGHALILDCSSGAVTPTPLPPAEMAEVVVVNTGPRSLGESGYAERVRQCAAAESLIGPLRLADTDDVERIDDPVLRARARHVVSENRRVPQLADALRAGDLVGAGRLIDASHDSLRADYEATTPAVERRRAELRRRPGVFGVRMTGGGWGGCVVALTRPGALTEGWVVRAVAGASVTFG